MEGKVDATTDLVSYAETLDGVAGSIDNLGASPEDVLAEPMSLVEDINDLFSITIDQVRDETIQTRRKARKSIQDAKQGVMNDIDTFVHNNKKKTLDGNQIAYVVQTPLNIS